MFIKLVLSNIIMYKIFKYIKLTSMKILKLSYIITYYIYMWYSRSQILNNFGDG